MNAGEIETEKWTLWHVSAVFHWNMHISTAMRSENDLAYFKAEKK